MVKIVNLCWCSSYWFERTSCKGKNAGSIPATSFLFKIKVFMAGNINHPNFVENAKKLIKRNVLEKQKRIEIYNECPNKCIQCNSVLNYEKRKNKFCSHTCAAVYNNNKGNGRHSRRIRYSEGKSF